MDLVLDCLFLSLTVHGNWGPWRDVGDCTKTCGGGQQKRQRVCDNPAPANGGNKCQGEDTDTVGCNGHKLKKVEIRPF